MECFQRGLGSAFWTQSHIHQLDFTPYVCLCWWRYYTFNCMCLPCISRTSVQTTDSQPVCQWLPAVSCSLSLEIVVDGIPSWSSPAAGGRYFLLFPPWLLLSSGAWRNTLTPSSSQPWRSSICQGKGWRSKLCVNLPGVHRAMYRCRSSSPSEPPPVSPGRWFGPIGNLDR